MAKTLNYVLKKVAIQKITSILEKVAEDVKAEIDAAINKYYAEYEPGKISNYKKFYYHRTEQLKKCCKISEPSIVDNIIKIQVYLDVASLKYETKGADPYKTMVAANAGLHGGFDPNTKSVIPWSKIKSNSGTKFGSGTQIWKEPIESLLNDNKLIDSFKKHAKKYGLNIE